MATGNSAAVLRSERLELVRLLEGLSDEEWSTPSLCAGWTAGDVAAHLAFTPVASPWELLPVVVRSGFRVNRSIGDSARHWSLRGREAILSQLRTNAETGRGPLGMPFGAVMTDALVHRADVGRPLGRRFRVPLPALESAMGFLLGPGSWWPLTVPMGGSPRGRVRGMRLAADDADWVWGEGEEVRASAETLLLLVAGRPVELAR